MARNSKMKKATEGPQAGVTMSKNTRNESSPRYDKAVGQTKSKTYGFFSQNAATDLRQQSINRLGAYGLIILVLQ